MVFKLKFPSFSKNHKSGETASGIRPLPLLGRLPFNRQIQLLGGGVVISLIVAVAAVVLDFQTTMNGEHYLYMSGRLVFQTQHLAKDVDFALQGKPAGIEGTPPARAEAERLLRALENGDEEAPAIGGNPRVILDKLLPLAKQQVGNIKDAEGGFPAVKAVALAVESGRQVIPQLQSELGQLSLSGEKGARVAKLDLMLALIDTEINAILWGGVITSEQIGKLELHIKEAEELLAGLDQSNPAVVQLLNPFNGYRDLIRTVIQMGPNLVAAKQSANKFYASTSAVKHGPFLVGAQEFDAAIQDSLKGRWTVYTLILATVIMLIFLALLERAYLSNARRHAAEAERINQQNQSAILRLMNELGDLADGDLRTRATVTEDITGAIADSVNYTVEELQRLVSRIVAAAEQMTLSTNDAEGVSKKLLEATQKQVYEIQGAGDSVQLMSRSIREVDAAANKAAEVGRHTLATTDQGAQAVRNTISGMDGIREQIQETSKRIKRLGESSQEIGEIVDLISDITEQTNVLALNAAIQAISAGEAGRGFSVVAEEVQRLAERSADATRKISGLVKTIQSDTHDAVAAMEKSTLGVVEGAKLSDMAGQSLKEIGQVSNELAVLINSISVSTQMQTDMADEVASAMQGILKITEQTTEGTRQTASSVAQLTTIATDLKGSVAGFKL